MADTTETVTERIVIEATLALKSLADLTNATNSFKQKLELATFQAKSSAAQWGVSFKEAKDTLAGLDKTISGTAESSVVFGGAGQAAWDRVGTAAEEAGNKTEKSTSRMAGGINLVRTALHVLAATIVFTVIGAFTKLVSMAITGLRELETATFNLINAERNLSGQGIEITPKDLDSYIQKLQKIDPLLSKIQATELVSSVSTKIAAPLGLSKENIESITQSIAILAVRNKGLGKSFEEVQSQIENGLLSGRVSTGINQLGVKINDQIVREKAVALGLIKTADAYDKLSGKEKTHIQALSIIKLLEENTNAERAHLPDYFKTADAAFGVFQARLQDVLTKIGTLLGPALAKAFGMAADWLSKVLDWMEKNQDAMTLWGAILEAFVEVLGKGLGLLLKFGTILGAIASSMVIAGNSLQKLIDKIPFLKKLSDAWRPTGIANAPDTPTASPSAAQAESSTRYTKAAQDAETKIQDIMRESADKKLEIERDYAQKLQEISTQLSDKLADIARDTARKREDALTDYSRKIEDINRDSAEQASKATQEAHQKEIEAEQKYQQALKELREKYLMDLEEALHDRDARQILRLMRQYKHDKRHLQDTRNLEKQQAKIDLQQKLAEIEREKQLKLEAARRELAEKLADIQLAEQREREDAMLANARALRDAALAHQRALAEQRDFLNRKLRDLADSLVKEYNLTRQGADAIYNLLRLYFGAGGLTDALFAQLKASMDAAAANLGTGAGTSTTPTTPGLAEGGTFLATRPTRLNVAENRPELISAVPLGKPGSDVNKFFSNIGGGGGGQIELAVTLSPDLEARVIRKSLDATGNIVMKINRSK